MGISDVDPEVKKGIYVEPENWNDLISDPKILLIGKKYSRDEIFINLFVFIKILKLSIYCFNIIDTRNDYEIEIGSFEGAINPNCESFRDFPLYIKNNVNPNIHNKIAMFCTGGLIINY
jgi:UPF0176 protein